MQTAGARIDKCTSTSVAATRVSSRTPPRRTYRGIYCRINFWDLIKEMSEQQKQGSLCKSLRAAPSAASAGRA